MSVKWYRAQKWSNWHPW